MKDEHPWCFKCWGVGHISRYCSASEKCGGHTGTHSSRTCSHRNPPQPTFADATSTSVKSSRPASGTTMWKCPRCHDTNSVGVNVWHGCTRRSHPAASRAAHPFPRPPPPPSPQPRPGAASPPPTSTQTDSPQVLALSEAVTNLTAQCAP